MVKPTGLHVYLNVTNVEKSAAFYGGLGFRKLREFPPPMRVIAYQLGGEGSTLLIGPSDMPTDDETAQWLKTRPLGAGVVLMPQVKSVEDVYAKAKAIGAEIEQPPTDQPWGSRTLMVSDPDGYSLMFDQPAPPARKAAKRAKKAKATKKSAKKGAKKASKKARRRG